MQNTISNKIIAFAVILIALPFFNIYGTPLALSIIIIECGKEVSNEQKYIDWNVGNGSGDIWLETGGRKYNANGLLVVKPF